METVITQEELKEFLKAQRTMVEAHCSPNRKFQYSCMVALVSGDTSASRRRSDHRLLRGSASAADNIPGPGCVCIGSVTAPGTSELLSSTIFPGNPLADGAFLRSMAGIDDEPTNTVLGCNLLDPHQCLTVAPGCQPFSELFASVGLLTSFQVGQVLDCNDAQTMERDLLDSAVDVIFPFSLRSPFTFGAWLLTTDLFTDPLDLCAVEVTFRISEELVVADVDTKFVTFGFDRKIGELDPQSGCLAVSGAAI